MLILSNILRLNMEIENSLVQSPMHNNYIKNSFSVGTSRVYSRVNSILSITRVYQVAMLHPQAAFKFPMSIYPDYTTRPPLCLGYGGGWQDSFDPSESDGV